MILNYIKNSVLYTLLLFTAVCSYAQYQITIDAYVLDKETNKPLKYVNVGFIGKGIGTVSNEEGRFTLVFDETLITQNNILQVSILGYETLQIGVSELYETLSNTNKIYLSPVSYELEEVLLTTEKSDTVRLGRSSAHHNLVGTWKNKVALGGEIATKFRIKNKNTKLLDLKFHILESLSDSLRVRVNVYKFHKNYPDVNLLKSNIYHTIVKKKGEEIINLRPYDILVDNSDIVIGLELIEVYGDSVGLALPGVYDKGISFTRYLSQDKWEKKAGAVMNFSVLTSVPPKDINKGFILNRAVPKRISLFWDTSLSASNRLINKELELLSAYIKKIPPIEIEVVKFSSSILSIRRFSVSKNNTEELINYLQSTQNNGATIFDQLLKVNSFNADIALMFTDGNASLGTIESEMNIPIFCINSSLFGNHELLQDVSIYSDGHYINLSKISVNEGLEFLTKNVTDSKDYSSNGTQSFAGTVVDSLGILQGALIRVKNKFIETQTDDKGVFLVNADLGDVLIIDYLGMKRKEMLIEDVDSIRIHLLPDNELLNEIVLHTVVNVEKETMETSYGKKNKDRVGYALNQITEDDIGANAYSLADVISRAFPDVDIIGQNTGHQSPKFIIRGGGGSINNPATAIFDVDGMIYSEYPDFIDPQQIKNITLLRSLIAANRYGTIGRGGVFLIKTKAFSNSTKTVKRESALAKNNDYDEKVPFIDSIVKSNNGVLFKGNTVENNRSVYFSKIKQNNLSLFVNAFDYFKNTDSSFAFISLSNIMELANTSPTAMKILAYKLEESNANVTACNVYDRISVLQPYYTQSYLNLARSSVNSGKYNEAKELYRKMLYNTVEGIDFTGIRSIIENEIMHLLNKYRTKVNFADLPNYLRRNGFKLDIRIVIEWNDPEAEFELQFVNPKRKFFTWRHNLTENEEEMLSEVKNGIHSKEFIIDDDENTGEWLINVTNLKETKPAIPVFVKFTVYKNYGLSKETKSIKVFQLDNLNQKVTLDSFFN